MSRLGNGTAGKVIFALILLMFLAFGFVTLFLVLLQGGGDTDFGSIGGNCTLKSASSQVQQLLGAENQSDQRLQQLLPKYKRAADKYKIPWQYVAAIHKAETNNGRTPTTVAEKQQQTSSVGAVGPGQFMWRTWVGWTHQVVKDFPGSDNTPFFGKGDLNLTPAQEKEITKVENITKYGGEGVDGNGDGIADPWNEDDAIEATAKKLAENGGASGDFERAILNYNRSQEYLNTVTSYATQFAGGASFSCQDQITVGTAPENVTRMIERAIQEMPNIDYVFGGNTPPSNGRRGSLDCSSFVQWLYREYLGINLPRTTTEQVKQGVEISKEQLRPGDLVFFQNTYRAGVSHVGLYIGDGKFINAVGTGKGVKIENLDSPERVSSWHSARRYFE